jgi:hypothetical protein
MNDAELTLFLFAFRYAVHRIPTQALLAIQSELLKNLPKMPGWMLSQMERDLEWNFELMEMHKEEHGAVKFDGDCEFQRDFLNAVKEQRKKLKEGESSEL